MQLEYPAEFSSAPLFVAPVNANASINPLWVLELTDDSRVTKLVKLKMMEKQVTTKCHNTTQTSYRKYYGDGNLSRGEHLHHNYDCVQQVE